jgi:Restriction endonuclease BglII
LRVVYEYSHLGGSEILAARFPDVIKDIYEVIADLRDVPRSKISKEKTRNGSALYSPIWMNDEFKKRFRDRGFRELRDNYTITVPRSDVKVEGAYKQVDFVREKILVEVQFGKYAFMFYDMAKFQYFFNENKAEVGVEIVPCHALHRHMSSGVSYGEQLVYDIERLRRTFPAVPVKIMLIDVEERSASTVAATQE